MRFIFRVAVGAVKPFPTCDFFSICRITWLPMEEEGALQHGDLMETWALRICLL